MCHTWQPECEWLKVTTLKKEGKEREWDILRAIAWVPV